MSINYSYQLPFSIFYYEFNWYLSTYLLWGDSLPRMLNTTLYTCFIGRQSVRSWFQNLKAIGQADTLSWLSFFESAATIVHLVLIRLLGSVYLCCLQHYHRAGSSYQWSVTTNTDLNLLIKIFVTILAIILHFYRILLNLDSSLELH